MRLIDADALIERLDEVYQDTSLYHEWRWFLTICEQEVENAPTIDAVPMDDYMDLQNHFVNWEPIKHGRWISIQEDGEGVLIWKDRCSVCGVRGHIAYDYCPHCGARMDGGTEDVDG